MTYVLTLLASSLLLVHARHPVILVNGLRGATLTASLNLPSSAALPHSYCKTKGTETMWVNPLYLVSGYQDCFSYYMGMELDSPTGIFSDRDGVTISNVDFGGVDGIITGYFTVIQAALTSQLGYTVGKDLAGAPYDWRMGAVGMTQRGYFQKLQKLTEDLYEKNGKQSVAFLTHSMGGPVILEFLNQMSQEWKNTYVFKYIAMVPPFGGAVLSVQTAISGSSIGGLGGDQAYLAFQRREATATWLLPQIDVTAWSSSETIVVTPSKNYTASDFDALFADINDETYSNIYKAQKGSTLSKFTPPNVDTYVLYGTGSKTLSKVTYSYDVVKNYVPKSPSHSDYEDGDDTVPSRSAARGQASWAAAHAANGYALEHTEFKGVSHSGMLANSAAIKKIVSLLTTSSTALRGKVEVA